MVGFQFHIQQNVNRSSWLCLAAATHCVETFPTIIFFTGGIKSVAIITNISCQNIVIMGPHNQAPNVSRQFGGKYL